MDNLSLGKQIEAKPSPFSGFKVKRNRYVVVAVVVLLAIVILLYVFINANNSQVTNITPSTNQLIDSYKSKIPELESKVELNPNDSTAVHDLAIALYATGDITGAKEKYLIESNLNPSNPVTFNNLGNAYRDTEDNNKAIEAYKKSIELDKTQVNAYLNLANLYIYTTNQFDLGINTLRAALESNPNNSEVMYMQIGSSYLVQNKKDLAKDAYNKVLEFNPNNSGAINALKNL